MPTIDFDFAQRVHKSQVGGVGLMLLVTAHADVKIAALQKTPCAECGAPLGAHAIDGDKVTCPPAPQ